jgi:hypothetical protein
LVRKKGGRERKAHVNRLKFYDPKNSHEDPETTIREEDDEEDKEEAVAEPTPSPETYQRITRSKTNNLPPPIDRFESST